MASHTDAWYKAVKEAVKKGERLFISPWLRATILDESLKHCDDEACKTCAPEAKAICESPVQKLAVESPTGISFMATPGKEIDYEMYDANHKFTQVARTQLYNLCMNESTRWAKFEDFAKTTNAAALKAVLTQGWSDNGTFPGWNILRPFMKDLTTEQAIASWVNEMETACNTTKSNPLIEQIFHAIIQSIS
jgi:hypothetical protein